MAWSLVSKPTGGTWNNVNPQGREQYDQSDIFYDDAGVFYDGTNPMQWTDVAKPSTSTWVDMAKPT